jgi:branched-chain amino acid transport system substrate-binding protein
MTLVKAGKDIDYDGPSGLLDFTDPGEPCSIEYVIREIQTDGTVKPLRTEWAHC